MGKSMNSNSNNTKRMNRQANSVLPPITLAEFMEEMLQLKSNEPKISHNPVKVSRKRAQVCYVETR